METEQPEHNDHTPHRARDSGTFEGHVWPGLVFMFFGCLWAYNALLRYHVARRQAIHSGNNVKKLGYKNVLFSKYHSGWAQATPVEAILVVLIATSAFIGEPFSYPTGTPVIVPVHHMLTLFFFGLVGVTKILQHYKFALPPLSEYAMYIIANAVFAFLFSNHTSDREIVNKQMHDMLVYFNIVIIICVGLEIIYKRNVIPALGRNIVLASQGIWMCAIALIDYPLSFMQSYDLTDHALADIVLSLGTVALGVTLMLAFAMNFIISNRVKNMNIATVNRILTLTHYQRIPSDSKGEAEGPLITDSDYEV